MKSNPMMSEGIFNNTHSDGKPMTVSGAVNKTLFLLLILVLATIYTWNMTLTGHIQNTLLFAFGWLMGGAVLATIMRFKPQHSNALAVACVACKGIALGAVSAVYEAAFNGIVINAVTLTFATMFAMLFLYKIGVLKATDKFKKVVATAAVGIMIFYLISIVTMLLGASFMSPFFMGPLGLCVSAFTVSIAALYFIINFDFLEKGEESGAPKYFEWYGAVAILSNLVWLYLEMLRLLAILRGR
ncbi:BAX inhibitor (BI)-1/YccA-like protein family [Candidatus Gastranaerophilus sp. (ex Termes propinquus)]|nr:BAX inhibitor (BI)-1/YccA-like protein family [Candidatus Gastranaerophilus sp. (ex Termes propinquus)]